MTKAYSYLLWAIQIVSLVIILVVSWRLLDRELFALVAASIVLATTLYLEHQTAEGGE